MSPLEATVLFRIAVLIYGMTLVGTVLAISTHLKRISGQLDRLLPPPLPAKEKEAKDA